jgi:adenylate cyclase
MASQIAGMLAAHVLKAESRLPLPAHPEAGHFVIFGRALMATEAGLRGTREAMAFFDKARGLDPDSYGALLGYGRTRVNLVLNRWAPKERWDKLLEEAKGAIEHAGRLDSRDPGLHVLRGAYLRAMAKDDEAIAEFEHAISLNPNFSLPHAELGRAKIEVGLASQTAGHIEDAISLNPTGQYRVAWYYWAGMAEVHLGRYEEAMRWLLKTRTENRAYPNTVPWLAVAHAGLGKWDEARAYMKEHMANFPRFSMASWRLALPHSHPVVTEQRKLIEALLRRLGAPETPPPDDKVKTGLAQ